MRTVYRVGAAAALDEGDRVTVAFYSGPEGLMVGPVIPAEDGMQQKVVEEKPTPEPEPEPNPTGKTLFDADGNPLQSQNDLPVRWETPNHDGAPKIVYYVQDYRHEARCIRIGDHLLIPNGLPILGELVALAEQIDNWQEPAVVSGNSPRYDPELRSSPAISVRREFDARLLPFEYVLELLTPLFGVAYVKYVNPWFRLASAEKYELLRYGPGQRFGEHIDAVYGNNHLTHRKLSVLAFWRTDDLKGGKLRYPRQGLEFWPEPGDVVIAPSGPEVPHVAEEVEEGFKWTLATWLA